MSMRDNNDRLTICEVLRMVNDRLQGYDYAEARDFLALAERMAKRMAEKLIEYNQKFDSEWWDKNPQYIKECGRELSTYLTGSADKAITIIGRRA